MIVVLKEILLTPLDEQIFTSVFKIRNPHYLITFTFMHGFNCGTTHENGSPSILRPHFPRPEHPIQIWKYVLIRTSAFLNNMTEDGIQSLPSTHKTLRIHWSYTHVSVVLCWLGSSKCTTIIRLLKNESLATMMRWDSSVPIHSRMQEKVWPTIRFLAHLIFGNILAC